MALNFTPEPGRKYDPGQLDRQFRQLSEVIPRAAVADNVYSYCPFKAVMAELNGVGVGANPTVVDSYNVQPNGVTWIATGTYRVQLDQTTVLGDDIITQTYPALTLSLGSGNVGDAEIIGGSGPGGYIDVLVYELATAGSGTNVRIIKLPWDLVLGDILWIVGWLNIELEGAEAVPE